MARLRIVSKLRDVSSADFRPEMCLAQSILSLQRIVSRALPDAGYAHRYLRVLRKCLPEIAGHVINEAMHRCLCDAVTDNCVHRLS